MSCLMSLQCPQEYEKTYYVPCPDGKKEVIQMEFVVKSKPNGFEVCRTGSEREARLLINAMESNDVREDRFEPDTYYIESEG